MTVLPMKFHSPIEFDIPDEWWEEAGMVGFIPASASYSAMLPPYPFDADIPDLPSSLVAVADIKPVIRDLKRVPGAPLFASKERLVRILQGIRENAELPPIHVTEVAETGGHLYNLCSGLHRFYACAAVGFTHIPAVVK
jgi:hypothetical protein